MSSFHIAIMVFLISVQRVVDLDLEGCFVVKGCALNTLMPHGGGGGLLLSISAFYTFHHRIR